MTAVNGAVTSSGAGIAELEVAADPDGKVAISGVAPSIEAAELACGAAANVEGVTEVVNGLVVGEAAQQASPKRWWELWK